jgi:hypothetical protein
MRMQVVVAFTVQRHWIPTPENELQLATIDKDFAHSRLKSSGS